MATVRTGTKVHPFPIEHAEGESNSLFTQEAQFSRDAEGRLVAPFSCFPPFRGESPFEVARGRVVVSDQIAGHVEAFAETSELLDRLAAAIKRKLPTAALNGGDVLIDPADLAADEPVE